MYGLKFLNTLGATALKCPLSALQLTSSFQKASSTQMSVPKAEEVPCDAVHAAAAETVHPGLGGDVQGGPPRSAPAEPPAGPVYAASGANDESPGKDDPTSQHLFSTTSKALKFCSYCFFLLVLLLLRSKKMLLILA